MADRAKAKDKGGQEWHGDVVAFHADNDSKEGHIMPAAYVPGPHGPIVLSFASGGVSTSYVTGNRTASITVTTSQALDAGSASNMVNGGFANNSTDSVVWGLADVTNKWWKFDFGTGKVVNEAKWYQQDATTHGNFKWQGSNDDSAYTDIGGSFALGGATIQTQTQLNGNTTSYRYYRMLGLSGSQSGGIWLEEIEFKQN